MSDGLQVRYQLFLLDFNQTRIFWHTFGKYSNINIKIRSVGAEEFHANGQTDTTKLIAAFRNFAKAPKNARFVFAFQNVPNNTNRCALFNTEVCVHSPEDECCVQQPVFETLTHQNVTEERKCYVILKGHVCVHCYRTLQKKQPLFYAYRLIYFNVQNMNDETRHVLCITYSIHVFIFQCDSRHKRFFVFDGTGVGAHFLECDLRHELLCCVGMCVFFRMDLSF
jgi:hypothetical protein